MFIIITTNNAQINQPKSLGARLRLRLEDLVNLSRRSLFGRVVRLPALFPFAFKRQQQDNRLEQNTVPVAALGANNDYNRAQRNDNKLAPLHKLQLQQSHQSYSAEQAADGTKSSNSNGSIRKTISSLRARQKRKRKEADRQMIFINGKQYYINDEGELKEWNEMDDKNEQQ